MHIIINLRGSIPTIIHITDGKYHDSKALDQIVPVQEAIYLMDKAYVDFSALYLYHLAGVFLTRANMRYDCRTKFQ